MSLLHAAARAGFSAEAAAYARGRPGYPPELLGWLGSELGLEAELPEASLFPHVHEGPVEAVIVDRIMSVSFIAALPAAKRAEVESRVCSNAV